jgi:hypothetical protein
MMYRQVRRRLLYLPVFPSGLAGILHSSTVHGTILRVDENTILTFSKDRTLTTASHLLDHVGIDR